MYRIVPLLVFVTGITGCTKVGQFESEHSHDRGKMKLADVGENSKYHAALTAHLSSKTGNELDVFFETADDKHAPVPLPLVKITAEAKQAAGQTYVLEFKPAPTDERKDDPAGKCSHFVAEAPWMKPDDTLTVTMTVEIDGRKESIKWEDFNPKKYAHVEE